MTKQAQNYYGKQDYFMGAVHIWKSWP